VRFVYTPVHQRIQRRLYDVIQFIWYSSSDRERELISVDWVQYSPRSVSFSLYQSTMYKSTQREAISKWYDNSRSTLYNVYIHCTSCANHDIIYSSAVHDGWLQRYRSPECIHEASGCPIRSHDLPGTIFTAYKKPENHFSKEVKVLYVFFVQSWFMYQE